MSNAKNVEIGSSDIVNVRFHTGFTKCNFSCEYCIAGHGNTVDPETEEIQDDSWNADRFERIVENLGKLPFQLNIRLQVPGEIFLNKRLLAGAKRLAQSANVRSLNILTNLSFSVDYYRRTLSDVDPSKWAFVASFHPTEVKDMRRWLEAATFFNHTYDFAAILVAYPALLPQLPELKSRLESYGLEVFVQAYIGTYDGRTFPSSYTADERQLLKSLFYSRHDYEFLLEMKKPGICNAGHRSFYIRESGDVVPCGMGYYAQSLGNIYASPVVKLNEAPQKCPFRACQCDTENMNTLIFRQNYEMKGINQHKYRFKGGADAKLNEWLITYDE